MSRKFEIMCKMFFFVAIVILIFSCHVFHLTSGHVVNSSSRLSKLHQHSNFLKIVRGCSAGTIMPKIFVHWHFNFRDNSYSKKVSMTYVGQILILKREFWAHNVMGLFICFYCICWINKNVTCLVKKVTSNHMYSSWWISEPGETELWKRAPLVLFNLFVPHAPFL